MASTTKIEWAEASWNPVTGCTPVSSGCDNCYALKMSLRLKAMGVHKYRNGFKVTSHPEALDESLHWKKPRRIFVCSMSDLFHEDVPDGFILKVFQMMAYADWHTYLILTKRPKRLLQFWKKMFYAEPCLKHIWLGVTAENQQTADERIPMLLQIPAAKRFVSLEPMLEPVDKPLRCMDVAPENQKINWVIVGAESGSKRRECKLQWVRDIVGQCKAAGTPVFIKQLHIDGKLSKNPDDWPPDLRVRQWPE